MKHTISFIKRVLSKLWNRQHKIDWLEADYALHDSWLADIKRMDDEVTERRLAELITERDRLRSKKKRFSHIQAEIEQIKTKQIAREIRT